MNHSHFPLNPNRLLELDSWENLSSMSGIAYSQLEIPDNRIYYEWIYKCRNVRLRLSL